MCSFSIRIFYFRREDLEQEVVPSPSVENIVEEEIKVAEKETITVEIHR